jgi:subtilisin family serine protease
MASTVNRVTSEDYADLLIEYNGDETVFDAFPNATIDRINNILAVVHVPVQDISDQTIIQLGYRVMPSVFGLTSLASLEASGVQRIRTIPGFDLRGQGVLIGIVDTGVDYTNPIFQNADKTSRIYSIWDQSIDSGSPPQGFGYGTEFTRDQINQALRSENPLDVVQSTDNNGHGTMIAGVAGGNEVPDSDFYGIATLSEYVVVRLKPAKNYIKNFYLIPQNAVAFQSTDLFFAISYLLSVKNLLQMPMVLCMALGTSQGSHDGRTEISSFISGIATIPGIAVLISGGNEGNSRRHYYGIVNKATGYDTVEINIGENEQGFSMEIWGQSPSIFSIDIQSPSGEYIPRIAAGMNENRQISFVFESTVIYLDYQMVESQSGDQLIFVRFVKPSPGIWRFNVYERGDLNLGFHIWLPMGNFITENTYFIRSNPYTTILSYGNSEVLMTVTAYNNEDNSLYLNASRGYNRLGAIKPSFAAPGVNITGPTLEKGYTDYSGTGVATAHASGVAAMLLEWGIVRGNLKEMNTVSMKKLIQRGARREVNIEYPNRDWGYGILDVYNVFDSLRTGIVV